ncbi:MAG TPA: methyltransferase domain-containing protein [Pseudonocardiaceae bacterium]
MTDYTPGWAPDMLAMLTARTAAERAGFLLPLLAPGQRVLDLGCGPGTITEGLADAIAPDGVLLGVDREHTQLQLARSAVPAHFAAARADALPIATHTLDVAFAHAVFEHLPDPGFALTELRRVLRPGGLLALSSSDWSGALLDPHTADVDRALAGHYRLRREAGGDPFIGGRLADLVRANGFASVRAQAHQRVDMTYRQLADYVHVRLSAAGDTAGAEAAARWAEQDGRFIQRWVEVTAHAPTTD